MIVITVQKDNQTVQIEFPCNDIYLSNQLREIGVTDPTDTTQLVKDCGNMLPVLSVLNNSLINLDFLNFLAKRLDSFSKNEMIPFEAAMTIKQFADITDIINLTYNLQNYTVITDFSDLEKVGKCHYLTVNMAMSESEKETIDFSTIGKQLVSSGEGIITPYGVLFENRLPVEQIFNGKTLPQYIYSKCVLTLTVSYEELSETLYLPAENIAIQKTIKRLGAESIDDCTVDDMDSMIIQDNLLHSLYEHFSIKDMNALNKFTLSVCEFEDSDFEKLAALLDYAGVHELDGAARLAENIGSFLFVPGVKYADDLGRYMIQKSGSYKYDADLEDFYHYEKFGNYLQITQEGTFTDYGYVGIGEDICLSEILSSKENDDMGMGELI